MIGRSDPAPVDDSASDPLEVLRRWVAAGGTWRVVGGAGGRLSIALLTCDGGEEMSRLTSDDERVRRFVEGPERSDDAADDGVHIAEL